jgi:hypothetical protein
MPTPTYIPLATTTLSSAVTTVTFSSISQSYRSLVLVVQAVRSSTGESGIFVRLNNDTGSNYSFVNIEGYGTSAVRNSGTARDRMYGSWVTNPFWGNGTIGNSIWNFEDYSASDRYKAALTRTNNGTLVTYASINKWLSTSAVTSISIALDNSGLFGSGSTFSLYGIASA